MPEEGVEHSEQQNSSHNLVQESTEERAEPADASRYVPENGPARDVVEEALARALEGATQAGRFDVVAQLARELEARRLARAGNVVPLPARVRRA